MRLAETVTFGGSGLERAAQMRPQKNNVLAGTALPTDRVITFWKGKPLIRKTRPAQLLQLPLDHPIFETSRSAPIFLGQLGTRSIFAREIDGWDPEEAIGQGVNAFLDPTEQSHPSLDSAEVFAELRRIMTWLSPQDAELAATGKALLGWHETHQFCAKCGAPSEMAQAGWQRDCPVCGAHHFPRTDPVVIMLITCGNSVLLGRSPGWPEQMYSLLAGFIEPGETIEAAVRREVFEEAGIKVGPVDYLASQPWPFPSSLMIGCAGEALSETITVDPVEIEDAQWVSRENILASFAGENSNLLPARKGSIAHFLLEKWLADRLD